MKPGAGLRAGCAWTGAVLLFLACLGVQAEPLLRGLAWPGYTDADIVKRFEERYKVKVQVSTVSSDESLWARVNANGGADVDVFAVNTAELKRCIDSHLVVPLNLTNIPNTQSQLPRFRNLGAIPNLAHEGRVYAVPYTYSAMGLIYDRKQLPQPPDSISALWDPRCKGRVLAFDTSSHNFSIAALALGKPSPFQIDHQSYPEVVQHLVARR
jgi:putative spermidine/putrescine transport system substrate-binding protein